MKTILSLLTGLFFLFNTHAQVGSLDSTFGTNGIQLYNPEPTSTNGILKVIPALGQQYYVVQASTMYFGGQNQVVVVAKYLRDGTLDISYGHKGFSDPVVVQFADAALQNDGKLIIAGSTSYGYYSILHDDLLVARLTTSGKLDPSFNQTGILTRTYTGFSYEFIRSVTVGENYIAVNGYSITLVGQFAFFHIGIIKMDGTFVATIFPGKFITNLQQFRPENYNYAVAFQGDKIVLAATTPDVTGAGKFFSLGRYLPNGSLDNTFGQQGITWEGYDFFKGKTLVAAQNDKILVSSYAYNPATNKYGFAIARYNNDGSADNSFNGNGRQVTAFGVGAPAEPTVILTQGDTIYIGGRVYNLATNQIDFAIVRYRNNGSLDENFDGDGKQQTGLPDRSFSISKLTVFDGRLLAGGVTNGAGVAMQYLLEENILTACTADKTLPADKGVCTAIVPAIDPVVAAGTDFSSISYKLTGATIGSGKGTGSGQTFNKGVTTVTYSSSRNPTKTCSFTVTVNDMEAPVITNATATPNKLWPPNHKMKEIAVNYIATDNCGDVTTVLSVTSNEAQDNTDKDDIKGDWEVINNHLVKLRAERAGKGNGRVYTITITATGGASNTITSNVTVAIPKNGGGDDDDDDKPLLSLKVMPNPTHNYFTLSLSSKSNEKVNLRVINIRGIVVEKQSGLSPNGSLRIGNNYSTGIYFAELVQGRQRTVLVLVKVK